jgi:uncharacterized protein (TIGR03000 family)
VAYGTPTVIGASASATLPAPVRETASASRATVIVKAPADARVTVNGQPATLDSTEQRFTTPTLEPGAVYAYTFKAEVTRDGRPVSRTQRVQVEAGREVRVDFSELAAPPGAPVASR